MSEMGDVREDEGEKIETRRKKGKKKWKTKKKNKDKKSGAVSKSEISVNYERRVYAIGHTPRNVISVESIRRKEEKKYICVHTWDICVNIRKVCVYAHHAHYTVLWCALKTKSPFPLLHKRRKDKKERGKNMQKKKKNRHELLYVLYEYLVFTSLYVTTTTITTTTIITA